MSKKKLSIVPVICVGIVAIFAAAFAIYMLVSDIAPRHADSAPIMEDPNLPTLVIYDGPQPLTSSERASVWVEGLELFVYDVMVNHEHIWNHYTIPSLTPMTYFDFEGVVTIEIEMPILSGGIESAEILPSAHGIVPTVHENRVTFTIDEPGFYTIIYNGEVYHATHIFANPLETDIPDRDDPNVVFIEPGLWALDVIALQSGQTLYISGGAVIDTIVVVDNAQDVTIRGRGIIDGSSFPGWVLEGSHARVPIDIRNSSNIVAEGFILANGNAWAFNSYSSVDLYASNIKIITGRQNGDGFTFQSCRNHTVENSFVRTWDDSLVLKNYAGSTSDITFRNIQVWTDLAQSMEIGYETNLGMTINPEISNVLFEDIFVLFNNHKPIISIHNSDDAYVHSITYRNIIVDNAFMRGDHGVNNELIEFHMWKTHWSTVTDEWGSIRNILIDGLTVYNTLDGRVPNSRILGHNAEHTIEDVTIRNVTILGERISTMEDLRMELNEYTANITIE